eukprot:g5245.t1
MCDCGGAPKAPEIKTTTLPPKVVIIGRAAVGKTSLIHKYRSDIFHENGFSATVGAAVFSEKYSVLNDPDRKSDDAYKLMFWDTAGEEKFFAVTKGFYRKARVGLFIYAMDDPESVKELAFWIKNFTKVAPPDAHVIVAGNKCDLEGSKVDVSAVDALIKDAVDAEGGPARTGTTLHFGPCSAKSGKGVKELFEAAVKLTYCAATTSKVPSDDLKISRVTFRM